MLHHTDKLPDTASRGFCKMLSIIIAASIMSFCSSITMSATMPGTVDGTINTKEVPKTSFAMSLNVATSALGTNVNAFVCTEATSILQRYSGGWDFAFRSKTLNTRFIHVSDNGKIISNNEGSPRGGQIKKSPAISVYAAFECATNFLHATPLSAVWIEGSDEWQVYVLTENGEVLLTVDSNKQVKQENVKELAPAPRRTKCHGVCVRQVCVQRPLRSDWHAALSWHADFSGGASMSKSYCDW